MIVAVPMKNRHELTTAVLDQLDESVEDPTSHFVRVIVIDNGSNDRASIEWLERMKSEQPSGLELDVLPMAEAGIHEMWNRAIDLAEGEPLCLLNNDVRLGPNFLAGMQEALDYDPRLLAVSANYDGRVIHMPVTPTRDICAGRYDGTGGFAGFAFAMRTDTGYRFPEQLKWWGGDNHLVAWAWSTGHWVGITRLATVEHLDGGSQTIRDGGHDPATGVVDTESELGRQLLADAEALPSVLAEIKPEAT